VDRYVNLIKATRNGINEFPKCEKPGCGQILFSREFALKHAKAHRPRADHPTTRSHVVPAKKEHVDRRLGPSSPEVRERRRAAMKASGRARRIARLRRELEDIEHPPEVRVIGTPAPPTEPVVFHRLEE
jgi:hypothetical protein